MKYPVARRDMAKTRVVLKDRTNGTGWSYNVLPVSLQIHRADPRGGQDPGLLMSRPPTILDQIGRTPLVPLPRIARGLPIPVLVK